jgi:uncharacterized membrane protein YkoI
VFGKRMYMAGALLAVVVLAGAAAALTSGVISADAPTSGQAGRIDDGANLLPQASITLDEAIAAAQDAATGDIGEVDLEHCQGKLVFNVDVGDKDVKVDAHDGTVVGAAADD